VTVAALRARGLTAVLAGFVVACLLVGGAWALAHRGPANTSLAQLAARQESYDGKDIRVEGAVRQFQDPDGTVYYVIEDGRPNRVELQPASVGAPYVGQQIVVVGTFHFDERRGRSITVQQVEAAGP